MKKIIFVIPSMDGGGAQKVLAMVMMDLYKKAYDVTLVVLKDKWQNHNILKEFKGNIIVLKKSSKFDFFLMILKLRSLFNDKKPDMVVGFLEYANILIVLANLFKKKSLVVLAERNYTPSNLMNLRFSFLKQMLIRQTYPLADGIISNSLLMKQSLVDKFKLSEKKIKVIYNPISLDDVSASIKSGLSSWPIPTTNVQVLMVVGRFVRQKRFDVLIDAFSLLKKKSYHANLHLVLLGDGVLKDTLTAQVRSHNLQSYAHFVGYQDNPYAWMSRADVFVLSSDFEGFPNVLLEAMACGRAVVSTDCPSGPNEIIRHGENGFLVPMGDPLAMCEVIDELLRNPSLIKKISTNARVTAENYDEKKILPKFEEYFKEIGNGG